MKTITIDFDLYQSELTQARDQGATEGIKDFKANLLSKLEVNQLTLQSCIQYNIPSDRLQSVKEPAQAWLRNNFTDEELKILLNK